VAVEVRHVVGQRVEVERPPRRRHLLNRSDVRRRSQPGWFFAFAAPAGEARGTEQSDAEGREVAEQEAAAAVVSIYLCSLAYADGGADIEVESGAGDGCCEFSGGMLCVSRSCRVASRDLVKMDGGGRDEGGLGALWGERAAGCGVVWG
jgi:hypothetical protein